MAFETCRLERVGFDLDRVRSKVLGRGSAPRLDSLGEQKSKRELLVVPGGSHRYRHGCSVDANLQRLLDGNRISLPPRLGKSEDLDPSSRVRRSLHSEQFREPSLPPLPRPPVVGRALPGSVP